MFAGVSVVGVQPGRRTCMVEASLERWCENEQANDRDNLSKRPCPRHALDYSACQFI